MRSTLILLTVTFLIAAIVHFSYIKWVGGARYKAENQDIENAIKVEEFLYESGPMGKNLIVGTSLSANVQHPGLLNLSLKGGAARTVLEILNASETLPEKILLETNFLYHQVDSELTEKFRSDVPRAFPMVQDRYRPLSLFLGVLTGKSDQKGALSKVPSRKVIVPELKATKVESHVATLSDELERDELEQVVAGLRKVIDDLESRGVELVFYETPFDAEVSSLPRQVQWRTVLGEEFPDHPIKQLAIHETATSDGIHLCLEGVLEMGKQLGLLAGQFETSP